MVLWLATALVLSSADPWIERWVDSVRDATSETSSLHDLNRFFQTRVDLRHIAKHALDSSWETLSQKERVDFEARLRRLLILRIEAWLTRPLSFSLTGTRVVDGAPSVRVIETTVAHDDGAFVLLRAHVHDKSGRIIDVEFDGTSMIRSYRASFSRIIRRGSYSDLTHRFCQHIERLSREVRVESDDAVPCRRTSKKR